MTVTYGPLSADVVDAAMASAARRFLAKVKVCSVSGCWLWRGAIQDSHAWDRKRGRAISQPNLRGRFWLHGRAEYAHRAAWFLFRGEAGEWLVMHSECDNSICVNPWHLGLGTYAENTADMFDKGRHPWAAIPEGDATLFLPAVPF